jgi:hypothetical protein
MSLSDLQWDFLRAKVQLIIWAKRQRGYKITEGCGRCHVIGHHKRGSFHYKGLAQDFNLFIDDVYQETTEAHERMGEKWESLGGTWGGRFRKPDGNHYSWGETRRL